MSVINQSEEVISPNNPSAGRWKSYFKAAGMFFKNSSGVEEQVASVSYVDSFVNNNAWANWTPTLANLTLGNGTLSCAYTLGSNKVCHFRFQLTAGSTTTISSTLLPTFTLPELPVNSHLLHTTIGNLDFYDTSTTSSYTGAGLLETNSETATVGLYINHSSGSFVHLGEMLDGVTVTLAAGDIIAISGQFEY